MSQLIQMRQRIKAVESIKKITHAMRLISMSTRSRLRQKKVHLENYKNMFTKLADKVSYLTTNSSTNLNFDSNNTLIILVGSQKGLCGNFNSLLFKFFEAESKNIDQSYSFISVGKHSTDYLNSINISPQAAYNNFNSNNYNIIAQAITQIILNNKLNYKHIYIYSNYPKSFFIQKPQKIDLLELIKDQTKIESEKKNIEFIFEQSVQELTEVITQLKLIINIAQLLFDSLLAEQCARFLSMDLSTRNAETLINQMKLEYNKTRQAAITKELTELSTSY